MGFTVVGADRFLGSGHPDLRERRPPFLGLIESGDAGRSWRAVSLEGKADFHVLEASGPRVYGYGSDFKSREERFMTSTDGGRSWKRLAAPEALISLAISPSDARRVVASGDRRAYRSRDGGRSWSGLDAPAAGLDARRPVPGRSPRSRKSPSRRVRGLAVNRCGQRPAGRV